ncbi:IS110 family transposase [Acetobacter suratthaniensis]|nr:IS110 family transposase [Acetobacter suratthaniensis]MCX2567494.1 IS110 family transposase [Acetobacter suratthaniensis]
MTITTIGLDLAKNVFQVHAIDEAGTVVVRKALRRVQVIPFFTRLSPCLIGIEACGTSHYWARELQKLGHEVRLMPPAYVKAYVKRGKTDAADAEAICEAVMRPTMRFVPVKSREQQAELSLHRVRSLIIKQRTQLINMARGHLAEFGVCIPQGINNALHLLEKSLDGDVGMDLPEPALAMLQVLARQALLAHEQIRDVDRQLHVLCRTNDVAHRLTTVPGVGPVGAAAFAAAVTDPGQFKSGRQFAAWLGLTPLQNSSGGKERSGRISKMGDKYLRKLLVVGATALVRQFKIRPDRVPPSFAALLERKPMRVATVAMANKMARIIWALLTRGDTYQANHVPAITA